MISDLFLIFDQVVEAILMDDTFEVLILLLIFLYYFFHGFYCISNVLSEET